MIEGTAFHYRWMLEEMSKKAKTSDPVRFVGGGALSPLTCQILADVLGRSVETVNDPQNVGALGAAAVMAVGLGFVNSVRDVKTLITVAAKYDPRKETAPVYNRMYPVFRELYKTNKKMFHMLNEE